MPSNHTASNAFATSRKTAPVTRFSPSFLDTLQRGGPFERCAMSKRLLNLVYTKLHSFSKKPQLWTELARNIYVWFLENTEVVSAGKKSHNQFLQPKVTCVWGAFSKLLEATITSVMSPFVSLCLKVCLHNTFKSALHQNVLMKSDSSV